MTRDEFQQRLLIRAAAAGVTASAGLLEALETYYRLLARWNEKINLTAIDLQELPPDAVDRLFIEPLAAARLVSSQEKVIDIGSGGGSPAIPFALASGASELRMVESRSRKSAFLQEAGRAVGLSSALAVTARFEDLLHRPEFDCTFDIVTIRAVRVASETLGQLGHFLKPTGSLLLFQRSGSRLGGGDDLVSAREETLTTTSTLSIYTKRSHA